MHCRMRVENETDVKMRDHVVLSLSPDIKIQGMTFDLPIVVMHQAALSYYHRYPNDRLELEFK